MARTLTNPNPFNPLIQTLTNPNTHFNQLHNVCNSGEQNPLVFVAYYHNNAILYGHRMVYHLPYKEGSRLSPFCMLLQTLCNSCTKIKQMTLIHTNIILPHTKNYKNNNAYILLNLKLIRCVW